MKQFLLNAVLFPFDVVFAWKLRNLPASVADPSIELRETRLRSRLPRWLLLFVAFWLLTLPAVSQTLQVGVTFQERGRPQGDFLLLRGVGGTRLLFSFVGRPIDEIGVDTGAAVGVERRLFSNEQTGFEIVAQGRFGIAQNAAHEGGFGEVMVLGVIPLRLLRVQASGISLAVGVGGRNATIAEPSVAGQWDFRRVVVGLRFGSGN